jgi:hypothetical protein
MVSKKSAKRPRRKKTLAGSGDEETPITMTGGSIIVTFKPDFDDDAAAPATVGSAPVAKKIKKVKSPNSNLRFTRVVIRNGAGGPILNEFPPPGTELSKGTVIEIKGRSN